jgi:hypothetical protein
MNAAAFIRRRSIIEHVGEKKHSWRMKALAALIRQAKAQPVLVDRRMIGHRLPCGDIVCAKVRYKNGPVAQDAMLQIQLTSGTHDKPVRIYACPYCQGWHLTSRA